MAGMRPHAWALFPAACALLAQYRLQICPKLLLPLLQGPDAAGTAEQGGGSSGGGSGSNGHVPRGCDGLCGS